MKKLLILILPAVLMFSCNKVTEVPQVITSNAVITDTVVTLSGEVTFTGDDDNTTRGFCWSESQSPTTADEVWIDNSTGLGLFNFSVDAISLLKPNTTYYCKTFAENEAGKSYGNEIVFTSPNFAFINSNGCVECNNCTIGSTWRVQGAEYYVADRDAVLTAIANNDDLSKYITSNINDMSQLFIQEETFNQDISNWDVSNVTTMEKMFYDGSTFNQDISEWDVSGVTDMSLMFSKATLFNQDIGSWDVSGVTYMAYMFREATNFNQDLTQWCVSNFSSMPTDFSTSSALTASNHPVWGTCP